MAVIGTISGTPATSMNVTFTKNAAFTGRLYQVYGSNLSNPNSPVEFISGVPQIVGTGDQNVYLYVGKPTDGGQLVGIFGTNTTGGTFPRWLDYYNSSGRLTRINLSVPTGLPTTTIYTPAGGAITLTFNNLQNMKSITDGITQRTTFPATYTVSANTTFSLAGMDSPQLTIQNGQNMKSVQYNSVVYPNFPVALTINGNTSIVANGEDDKTITVNYTNTKVPVISDT